jgi:hypothetical protein
MQASFDSIDLYGGDLSFSYVVENNTGRDYSGENTTELRMFVLRKDSTLSYGSENRQIRIETPFYIPAKRRALVRISLPSAYTPTGEKWAIPAELARRNRVSGQLSPVLPKDAQTMYRAYVRDQLPRLNGFVLRDHRMKMEIVFPAGW